MSVVPSGIADTVPGAIDRPGMANRHDNGHTGHRRLGFFCSAADPDGDADTWPGPGIGRSVDRATALNGR